MIFRWFESLIDAFKEPSDDMPPQSVLRFYTFYLKQVWPAFAAAIVVGFGVAIVEVALFDFIGRIVDMTKSAPTPNFFREHGRELVTMALVTLIARPVLNFLHRTEPDQPHTLAKSPLRDTSEPGVFPE